MTCYHNKLKVTYIICTMLTLFACVLITAGIPVFERTGDNYFHVYLKDTLIGTVGDRDKAENLLAQARREVAMETSGEELLFVDAPIRLEGEEVIWGLVDSDRMLIDAMKEILQQNVRQTMQHSYTVKVNEYMVSLKSLDEVESLLQATIGQYDAENLFTVELNQDAERDFNVLMANVVERAAQEEAQVQTEQALPQGGVEELLVDMGYGAEDTQEEMDFSDYQLGLKSMGFAEEVEIVEAYLPTNQLSDLNAAIDEVTKEQETPSEYEIVAGDTLSEIAIKVNIPMDKIVAMNPTLEDANTPIRVGDKLIITVPEPELSVERVEQGYFEEIYDADVIYVDNNDWYTTQTKVLQQPSAGFRKIVANVSFLNDAEVAREILKEEVVMEAVPKIVERGTKTPPTYIKPISGGRLTSGFGKRKSPTKGASTYHKGVDWATPTGTPVYASCGGTVAKAGWGSGYGYVVYINHEDGRQTRYGHLSKVLVKAGQKVKQNEKIALSGNTGITSGPHVHFEILINGVQVNPLKYLN